MQHTIPTLTLWRRSMALLAVLAALAFALAGCAVPGAPGSVTPVEPEAGTWQTWVLESGSQVRLPPPAAPTAAELKHLQQMVGMRDDAALRQIAYWHAGPPAYRWNQIALAAMNKRAMPGPMGLRDLALLHAAVYDATVAAWDSKYAYNRPRPSQANPALTTVIPNPASPSYPSEVAVTAGAASAVLSWLFPEEAESFAAKAKQAADSELLAGVAYPSDVEAGLELGRKVAELVIARGMEDGATAKWEGSVPTEPGRWTGENPAFATGGAWKTWVLASPDQFRPGPPPAYDSEQLAAEMDELRAYQRTPVSDALASFWEHGAGGRRIHWLWNDLLGRLVLESGLADNAPRAARAYALANIAGHDAFVSCWDAKYEYWAMRPFQLDPEFKPVFTTPNHPGYPSAHSCLSIAMTDVMAHLFPAAAEEVTALAQEATESRIWGGIHFRSDIVAGVDIGHKVAEAVLSHAGSADLAELGLIVQSQAAP